MLLDLASPQMPNEAALPWNNPADYWNSFTQRTADLPAPVIAVHEGALSWNAHDLLRRAGGVPIRVASKSVRVRGVLDAVLRLPGFRGILAYTVAEAIWLAEFCDDVVVGYPSVDRGALTQLISDERAAQRVTLMVDDAAQLDLIDQLRPAGHTTQLRVCIDVDAGYRVPILGHFGVLRSPVHTAGDAVALARLITDRHGFTLVGAMSYEAQIAGVANQPRGKPISAVLIHTMQTASARELSDRRAAVVAALRAVSELEFVNAGGTGSLHTTVHEASVTEVTAGSGLFGPHLFDHYREFSPAPAVAFACDVVRKPDPQTATLLGGGWIASGQAGADRLPAPVWPPGLQLSAREGAGEVQTPVRGAGAGSLRVGDRVWLRHTKSGEVMEHGTHATVISSRGAVDQLPTYRGEGRCFL